MKKFLSLVLALAMTMSLVTISAGAKDFTDADDITYVEAVEVMTAIGVVDGDTAGNFNPTNGLTRGAAAKIICNMILGPTTAAELNADTAPYTDVAKNSTFAGYIAYCQKAGIISGYADGTFKPAAPLTGYAFMKMLLGALGYDADVEGYTGANWSINVAKRALGIGLNDGLVSDFNGSDYVTRQDAMLYAFNALQADMVSYETTIKVGDVTIAGSKAEVVAQTGYKNTMGDSSTLQFAEKYFSNLKKTDGSDDFNRPATTWFVKNTKVGTYAETPDLVYTGEVKGKVIYSDLGEPSLNDKTVFSANLNGTKMSSSYELSDIAKNQNDVGDSKNGVVTEVFWDADYDESDANGKLTIVSYNYWLVQADEDYDVEDEEVGVTIKSDISLDDCTLSADDFAVENVKEDDYLVITATANVKTNQITDYTVRSVEAAEVVENVVVSKARDNDYVVAGGETYKYSDVAEADSQTLGKNFMAAASAYKLNDDGYNLYLDPNGYVLGIKGYDAGDSLDDYLFIKNIGSSGFDAIAKAVFMDGTSKTITVDKINGEDVGTYNNVTNNQFYTFDVDSDGNYELTRIGSDKQWAVSSCTIAAGSKPLSGSVRSATSATVFIAKDKAYVGAANAPTVGSTTVYVLIDDNGRLKAVYTGSTGVATNDADEYVYILSNSPARMKDGDNDYYVYDAIVSGEKTTLDANQNNKAVGLYKIDTYTNGRADLGTAITTTSGLVAYYNADLNSIAYKDGTLTMGDTVTGTHFILADNVTIITVDSSDNTVKTINASGVEKQLAKDFDTVYAIKTSTTDDDICTVYMVK